MEDRKILFVDDEWHVLSSFKRTFKRGYTIDVADSGQKGLEKIETEGPFAVVVSDMRMPKMNGIEFLTRVRQVSPDTVRIMLTGQADFNTAMEAVNKGNIFRFVTKPITPVSLKILVDESIKQYNLIRAEQDLLENTLNGSVKVLIDIMSTIDPDTFSKNLRLRDMIRNLSQSGIFESTYDLEIAALLSQIGRVTIPPSVLAKMKIDEVLSGVEKELLESIPSIGHDLLVNIPRLESVAEIILYQKKDFNGDGFPKDGISGTKIPRGARIIRILSDYQKLKNDDIPAEFIESTMKELASVYDPILLDQIIAGLNGVENETEKKKKPVEINLDKLRIGQTVLENVETENGQLLIMAGQLVTETIFLRIKNWSKIYKIKEPILVLEN